MNSSLKVHVIIVALVLFGNVYCAGTDVPYQQRINTCFQQLFQTNLTCLDWAQNNFVEDGAWYHPNLPDGAHGWNAIADFCSDTRADFAESVYLPTVLPRLTHSGEYSYASVDYVFASNQITTPFANWGNVFFALPPPSSPSALPLIQFAVETWDRRVWPDQITN